MKQWLSLQTIAKEYADLGERTLRQFLSHPTHPLPARLVGGKWLIAREDFDAWARSFPRASEDIDRLVDEVLSDVTKGVKHGQKR
jgi:hypothetical protein